MVAKLHLFMAAFWTAVTVVVFLFGLEGAVWVVLIYSAYANVYTSIDGYHARKAQEEMERRE